MRFSRIGPFLLFVILLSVTANAFDCERKGLIIGGGLGIALISNGSSGAPWDNGDQFRMATNATIGYAWDEKNMVVLLVDAAKYLDTLEVYHDDELVYRNEYVYSRWFTCLGLSHYFAPSGRSPFVTVGIGVQGWLPYQGLDDQDTGIGFLVGGGYEFARHFELYASFSFSGADIGGPENDYTQLVVTLRGLIY